MEKERKEKVEKEAILTKDEPAKQERKKVTLTPAKKVVALPVTISTEVQAAGAMEEGVPMEEGGPSDNSCQSGGPNGGGPSDNSCGGGVPNGRGGCPSDNSCGGGVPNGGGGCPSDN